MKKFIALLVTFVMLLSVNAYVFADDTIKVTLDGNYIEFDVKPQTINGRTMVPIRAIFEKMGATVKWDESTSSATCTKGNVVVKMTVNSTDMYINNKVSKMDIAPVVKGGRTLAPARFAAQAFGAYVEWDESTNTVKIYSVPDDTKAMVYATDGRTKIIKKSEVDAYLKVGWYRTLAETQQTVYAPDGRTKTVYKAEVDDYINVGWYRTKTEAQNANKPKDTSTSTSKPSTSTSSGNSNADGYYYRTPTGKRYHLDPDCGGKNSYRTTNISGLLPCSKCA